MLSDTDDLRNPFIGTTTDVKAHGVNLPGFRGHTFDWRAGSDRTLNSYKVQASMTLRRWEDASTRVFAGDEFLVAYSILGPDGQRLARYPRVCKASVPWLEEQGYRVVASCMVVDIDNPGHRAWTDEDRERAHVEHATIDLLKTCGVYWTRGGRRLLQPLDQLLGVEDFEARGRAFLMELERAGVVGIDHGCKDWSRYFRLPYVTRDRVAVVPEEADYSRMVRITPPAATAPGRVRQRTAGSKSSTPGGDAPVAMVAALDWSREVPPAFTQLVLDLAAMLLTRTEEWHRVFLALAGALCERGVASEHVPAIVRAVSVETRADDRTESREQQARDTVVKRLSGMPVSALKALRALDPRLADVVERHTATKVEAQVRATRNDVVVGATTLEQATLGMQRSIASAFGVVGVEAGCGMGKSQAALAVAEQRNAKTHVDPDATGGRAPAGSKTAIACPTNALAIQHTENLRRRGVKVLRVYGALSQKNADGTYACHYGESAQHLVAGGQSQQWELCEGRNKNRCDHYEGCTARRGMEGPEDARVVIGSHAKISTLSGEAGTTGMLVIDEPPQAIVSYAFTLGDFDALLAREEDFTTRYWTVLLPMIQAARYTLEHGDVTPVNEPYSAASVVWHGWAGIAPGSVQACLEAAGLEHDPDDPHPHDRVVAAQLHALPEDAKGSSPSLRVRAIQRARGYPTVAARLGRASALARALWGAATQTPLASIRVSDFGGKRELVIALLRGDYVETLHRTGPTVLLDAGLDVHTPVVSRIVGYQIPVHRFHAPDGCPVERTLFLEPRARKKHWLRDKWPAWEEGLASALEAIVDWTLDRPWIATAALITVSPVARALLVALGGAAPAEMPPEVADAARAVARPILARARCQWMVGYYGNLRGLDAMAGCDALATLMDPVPNLDEVQHNAAYYELEFNWEEYLRMLTRADLEQAHGRLRLVHRTQQAAACHVGSELPGGYGWCGHEVVIRREKLRRRLPPMAAADLMALMRRLGISTSDLATRLGISTRSVRFYLSGDRAIPDHVADAVRRLDAAAKG